MNHADVKRLLADYLEGDLALEDRAVVDAHLDQCEACSREVGEIQQTIRLLRTMPEPEIPPMITANVMRRIRAGETRPGLLLRTWRGLVAVFEPSFVLPASAVAAAALVVVVIQDPSRTGLEGLFQPKSDPVAGVRFDAGRGRAGAIMATVPAAARERGETFAEERSRRATAAEPVVASPLPLLAAEGFAGSVFAAGAPPTFVSERRRMPRGFVASVPFRPQGAPSPIVVSDRRAGVAIPTPVLAPGALDRLGSGGADPRDDWLAFGLEQPGSFAAYLTSRTLAEQELWISRLAARADSRGLLEELVRALEGVGDEPVDVLAADFRAASPSNRGEASARR